MAIGDFLRQLQEAGYLAQDLGENRVSFPYIVETGKFAGRDIELGFVVPVDFPLNPPTGPHIRANPVLLPLNNAAGGVHPTGGIHDSSQFGSGWQYWSRPMNHWAATKRTVMDVIRHVRYLFETQ